MSNKTQLQTNNANLDALITRVNAAKNTAASLPEAGSSGGSGGGQTYTVTIQNPPTGIMACIFSVLYMNNTGIVQEYINGSNLPVQLPSVSGLLVLQDLTGMGCFRSMTELDKALSCDAYSMSIVYNVTSDLTINLS